MGAGGEPVSGVGIDGASCRNGIPLGNVSTESSPAGIVTAPAGADVYGLASVEESAPPLQSWVPAGGDVGAVTLASAVIPEKATATPANSVVQMMIAKTKRSPLACAASAVTCPPFTHDGRSDRLPRIPAPRRRPVLPTRSRRLKGSPRTECHRDRTSVG